MASEVTFAPKGSLKAFDTPDCDAWVVRDVASFEDFIAIYYEKAAAVPQGHHLFSSFDWYGQACYTSGHARSKYDLDPDFEIEESDARFAASHQLFMAKTGKIDFADLTQRLLSPDGDEESRSLEDLNTKPDKWLDAYIVMQIVPVAVAEDALSVFPNGYFVDDLTPFEVHALAAHFRVQHAYRLIAIGASYVCFLRDVALTEHEARAVARDIKTLFKSPAGDQTGEKLIAVLIGKRHLILRYVNN